MEVIKSQQNIMNEVISIKMESGESRKKSQRWKKIEKSRQKQVKSVR